MTCRPEGAIDASSTDGNVMSRYGAGDVSPYFEIVKFNALDEAAFDYKRLEWEKEETGPPAGAALSSTPRGPVRPTGSS